MRRQSSLPAHFVSDWTTARARLVLSRGPVLAAVLLAAHVLLLSGGGMATTMGMAGTLSATLVTLALIAALVLRHRVARRVVPTKRVVPLADGCGAVVASSFAIFTFLALHGGSAAVRSNAALEVALCLACCAIAAPTLTATLVVIVSAAAAGVAALALSGSPADVPLAAGLGLVATVAATTCVAAARRGRSRWLDRARSEAEAQQLDLILEADGGAARFWTWQTDAKGRFRDPSAAMATIVGLPASTIEGATLGMLVATRSRTKLVGDTARAVMTALADQEAFRDTLLEVPTVDGSLWWRLSGRPVFDALGDYAGHRGVGTDITAQKRAEAKVEFLAGHDPATGFVNRAKLVALVAAQNREPSERLRALLYLDVYGVAEMNAGFGREVGDRAIKELSERWRLSLPRGATAARIGGDEFAIFYAPLEEDHAETLAETMLAALREPFDQDGATVQLDGAVGIAFADGGDDTLDLLIDKASVALHRAKATDRKHPVVFTGALVRSLDEQKRFAEDLKLALARGECELHYQPLLDLASGSIVSFEALIRWRSPTRGFVSPGDFIPAAEASGLIVAIGRFVLMQACKDAATWAGEPKIAVNISPKHFRNADFTSDVRNALAISGLPAHRLEIEITEGVFFDQSPIALQNLAALRERGVRIALDDFGTGYSSLTYLVNFPVDKIKIDRSFIIDYVDRAQSRAIVDAILELARKLSIRVTAEGVETLDQALALKLRHCDDIQGFLISRPQPGAAIPRLLEDLLPRLEEQMPTLFESRLAAMLAMKKRA